MKRYPVQTSRGRLLSCGFKPARSLMASMSLTVVGIGRTALFSIEIRMASGQLTGLFNCEPSVHSPVLSLSSSGQSSFWPRTNGVARMTKTRQEAAVLIPIGLRALILKARASMSTEHLEGCPVASHGLKYHIFVGQQTDGCCLTDVFNLAGTVIVSKELHFFLKSQNIYCDGPGFSKIKLKFFRNLPSLFLAFNKCYGSM